MTERGREGSVVRNKPALRVPLPFFRSQHPYNIWQLQKSTCRVGKIPTKPHRHEKSLWPCCCILNIPRHLFLRVKPLYVLPDNIAQPARTLRGGFHYQTVDHPSSHFVFRPYQEHIAKKGVRRCANVRQHQRASTNQKPNLRGQRTGVSK